MIVETAPPPDLASIVDAFWYSAGGETAPFRVLPDGCADVIFDCEAVTAIVVGTMTRPLHVGSGEGGLLVGIRFRAGRAAPILRQPLGSL